MCKRFFRNEKLDEVIFILREILPLANPRKKRLSSAIGKGRRFGGVYRVVNAFMRSLERHLYPWDYSYDQRIVATGAFRRDIELAIKIMHLLKGKAAKFDWILGCALNADFTVYTDATTTVGGIGGHLSDGQWFQTRWTEVTLHKTQNRDIIWRELSAIIVAITLLGSKLKNKSICIWTDSMPCKDMLVKMRANFHREDLQILINFICLTAVKMEFNIFAFHVKGKVNFIADALSRFQPKPFAMKHRFKRMPQKYETEKTETNYLLQKCADLCQGITVAEQHLVMNKTEMNQKKLV